MNALARCVRPARGVVRSQVRNRSQITLAEVNAPSSIPESEVAALLKKAEGPWGALSQTEKTNLYRAMYKKTRKEIMASKTNDTPKIVGTFLGAVALSWTLFTGINSMKPEQPGTLSKEWKAAEDKNLQERGHNPVFGYGNSK